MYSIMTIFKEEIQKTKAEATKADQQTELQFFDNQHESSQMNHELEQELLMDNSCEIHDNSCEKDKTDNSCIKDFMSPQAKAVMDIGREVWRYYMQQAKTILPSAGTQMATMGTQMATMKTWNVNDSLYDIKAYFKGRDAKGRMNTTSPDEHFNTLMEDLRVALQDLAKKIEVKVYEYGFLK